MAEIKGSCRCGKVSYSTSADPVFAGICHCKILPEIDRHRLCDSRCRARRLLDRHRHHQTLRRHGDTGKPTHRDFCPECGSTVTQSADVMAGVTMVAAGTMDRSGVDQARHADLLRQRDALGHGRRHAKLSKDAGITRSQMLAVCH